MSAERQDQGTVQIALRISPSLRERIKAAAEANNRSVNKELVATLEERYPGPSSPDEQKWFALQDEIEARQSKSHELWEMAQARKGTPEYHGITDELLQVYREIEALRDQQDHLWSIDLVEVIEKHYEAKGHRRGPRDGYGGDGTGDGYGHGNGAYGFGDGDGDGDGFGDGGYGDGDDNGNGDG